MRRYINEDDRRYTMRMRGLNDSARISMDIFEHDAEAIGVWDNVEKRFVKRDQVSKEWVPE